MIGKDINGFHVVEKLGQGGMAEVYKAVDLKLEREVAIKFLRTSPEDYEVNRQRFELEAKAVAKLRHQNIVSVLGYGEYEGRPYLVMEYVQGKTLKELLGKPMPWQKAASILIPIAKALHHAHSKKIIHRDVKPSNIIINEEGEPMLTDFGVAKILGAKSEKDLTATNVGIGTPHYMAPEQGRGQEVGPKSDIYSLGVVLYEMVTGRKPYEADTPFAVLLKHIEDPVPNPAKTVRGLPQQIERVILKAMSKNPKNRFENMLEFASALEGQGSLKPVKPEKTKYRSISLPRPLIFGLIGIAAMVVVAWVFGIGNLASLFNRDASTIEEALLYSGPGKSGYEELIQVKTGTQVEPLGIFGDFVFVNLNTGGDIRAGFLPSYALAGTYTDLPRLTKDEVPWRIIYSFGGPFDRNNMRSTWQINRVRSNIDFSDALQIDLVIESTLGETGIELWADATPTHWVEIYLKGSTLHFMVNKNITGWENVYEEYLPITYHNVGKQVFLSLKFEQDGNYVHIFNENTEIFTINLASLDPSFQNGFFQNGLIKAVEIGSGPYSEGAIPALTFLVPPDENHLSDTKSYLADLRPKSIQVGWGSLFIGTYTMASEGDGISVGDPIILEGTQFDKGLFAHAPSRIVYDIGGGYHFLETVIGKELSCGDGVIFKVVGDGNVLYQSELKAYFPTTQSISIDIMGVKEIKLIAEPGPSGNIECDHAIWGDPVLIP
jgi:serine/threonine protein kinase